MKRFLFLIIAILGLVGCHEGKDHFRIVSSQMKKYEIIAINPPKHFYITIKNVETGQVFKNLYVSKHCNSWKRGRVGDIVSFKETIYEDENGAQSVSVHVKNYCALLKNK